MDLGALFPEAAARWLTERGHSVVTGQRVQQLRPVNLTTNGSADAARWQIDDVVFDRVILATAPTEAARLVSHTAAALPRVQASALHVWAACARRAAPRSHHHGLRAG